MGRLAGRPGCTKLPDKLCLQTVLSPDVYTGVPRPAADYLRFTLTLVDVATGETMLQFKATSATPANLALITFGVSRLVDSGYRFGDGILADSRF